MYDTFFFFYCYGTHPDLHSFPTRRSSDLRKKFFDAYRERFGPLTQELVDALEYLLGRIEADTRFGTTDNDRRQLRSEEHTSELQSLAYLVCRLLLEKKKNKNRY